MLDLDTLHRRARRVLPLQIETCRVVLDAAGEAGLAALLLPLRHRPYGSIVFELSRGTLSALKERSLRFLQDARTAREGLGRRSAPRSYDAWEPVVACPGGGFVTTSHDGHASLRLDTCGGLAIYAWDDAASVKPAHGVAPPGGVSGSPQREPRTPPASLSARHKHMSAGYQSEGISATER